MTLSRSRMSRRPTTRLVESRLLYRAAGDVVDARSGGRCEICRNAHATEHQHRIRRGTGGSSRNPAIHRVSSLLHLCQPCHHDADHHPDRFDLGWSVRRGNDPAAQPVLLGGEFWLLADDGTRTQTPRGGEMCAENAAR